MTDVSYQSEAAAPVIPACTPVDSRFAISQQAAQPLLRCFVEFSGLAASPFVVTQQRQGAALVITTSLLQRDFSQAGQAYPLFFILEGNELYSNLRAPSLPLGDCLQATDTAVKQRQGRLLGLSRVQLFSQLREIVLNQ